MQADNDIANLSYPRLLVRSVALDSRGFNCFPFVGSTGHVKSKPNNLYLI